MNKSKEQLEYLISTLPCDDNYLFKIIGDYEAIYKSENIEILYNKLINSINADLSSLIIASIGGRMSTNNDYWALIFSFINGVYWDEFESLKLSAVSAIRFYNKIDNELNKIVRKILTSENPIIVDEIYVVSQIKSGIDIRNVNWGTGNGQLSSEISTESKKWLNLVLDYAS